MIPSWNMFIDELQQLCTDPMVNHIFNLDVIKAAISKVREEPRSEYVYDSEFTVLMRSLIVYRFIKNFT